LLGGTRKVLAILDVQQEKVEGLKARRKRMFESFEKHPDDIELGFEIKIIDDEIEEYKRQMQRNKINQN
jgi:hypothetical protein